jgi:hypothetical protein
MGSIKMNNVANRTFSHVLSTVNDIYKQLFTKESKTDSLDTDQVLVRSSVDTKDYKNISLQSLGSYFASLIGSDQNQRLVEWAQGKDYEPLSITRDSEGRITLMSVSWPDSSSGFYNATDYNATHEVYDGFTITHADSGKTVTQSAVTRNAEGAVITKPNLTVA